jgi:predicted HicB family RNase H-like nuclease
MASPVISLTLRLTPDQHKAANKAAAKAQLSLTEWIREAMAEKAERQAGR